MTATHVELCPSCGHVGPHGITVMTDGKHYAKVHCNECNRFLRWLPKPEAEKAKRPSAHRDLVGRFGNGYCEMCGIRDEHLPKGESLEGHHCEAYQDGGEPTRENTWILCTPCHKLVEWRRTYVKHTLAQLAKYLTDGNRS